MLDRFAVAILIGTMDPVQNRLLTLSEIHLAEMSLTFGRKLYLASSNTTIVSIFLAIAYLRTFNE